MAGVDYEHNICVDIHETYNIYALQFSSVIYPVKLRIYQNLIAGSLCSTYIADFYFAKLSFDICVIIYVFRIFVLTLG